MTEETKTYVNIALEGKEEENFLMAKEYTGIKGNSEFIRFLIRQFIITVQEAKTKSAPLKFYKASELNFNPEDLAANELTYRRGFAQGFFYRDGIKKRSDIEETITKLHEWRHKVSPYNMIPFEMYKSEKKTQ